MQRIILSFLLALGLLVRSLPLQAQGEVSRHAFADSLTLGADTLRDARLLSEAKSATSGIDASWLMPSSTIGGLGAYGLGGISPLSPVIDGASWRLHQGFNAQFGLSVSAGLGKHAPKGVGFGQTAAFAYVAPITPKLSVAAGLFAVNQDWGAWRRTDVGVGGVVAYEVNDRINLYAYGSKSFVPRANDFQLRRDPFALFLQQQRDRIGAAAEFKIGQNAMIGVSVERSSY